mmetsp:Transcript_23150/g.45561  ORF Transcript_23150/g.45561 Transcript_23150/m.45561 type:complete len:86 (+) Transcript_23150:3069-3326(+)
MEVKSIRERMQKTDREERKKQTERYALQRQKTVSQTRQISDDAIAFEHQDRKRCIDVREEKDIQKKTGSAQRVPLSVSADPFTIS